MTKQPSAPSAPAELANDLWFLAHTALCHRNWNAARWALDRLIAAGGAADALCEPGAYGEPQHLADRVREANALVS